MCKFGVLSIGLLSVLVALSGTQAHDSPIVHTDMGDIVGTAHDVMIEDTAYTVHTFLGIPYAKAPVGNLRFKKPLPIERLPMTPWDASEFGSICPQPLDVFIFRATGVESEDCLFLNVYAPRQPAEKPSGHAVMIYIHGGSLIIGSSNDYDGTYLAAYGNVVVVTFNYRLGALGFMSTGDSNCPGNFGIWDQRLVFKWVQKNIKHFHGDSNRVTIFGNSAGGMSTVIHAMSASVNRNLFHRVIAQSGVPYSDLMALERDVIRQAMMVAYRADCNPGADTASVIACLRAKNWTVITEAVVDILYSFKFNNQMTNFDPVKDDEFINIPLKDLHKMSQSLNNKELEFFKSLDFMAGVVLFEGSVFPLDYLMEQNQPLQVATRTFYHRNYSPEIYKAIGFVYTDWNIPKDDFFIEKLQMTALYGDLGFGVPAVNTSRLHAINNFRSKTYMYQFLPAPTCTNRSVRNGWLPGAMHEDELQFLFGKCLTPGSNLPMWEKMLALSLMTYWSNFAKTGDPNQPGGMEPKWEPYTMDNQHYMELDRNLHNGSCRKFFLAEKTYFWEELLPALAQTSVGSQVDSVAVVLLACLSVYLGFHVYV